MCNLKHALPAPLHMIIMVRIYDDACVRRNVVLVPFVRIVSQIRWCHWHSCMCLHCSRWRYDKIKKKKIRINKTHIRRHRHRFVAPDTPNRATTVQQQYARMWGDGWQWYEKRISTAMMHNSSQQTIFCRLNADKRRNFLFTFADTRNAHEARTPFAMSVCLLFSFNCFVAILWLEKLFSPNH